MLVRSHLKPYSKLSCDVISCYNFNVDIYLLYLLLTSGKQVAAVLVAIGGDCLTPRRGISYVWST